MSESAAVEELVRRVVEASNRRDFDSLDPDDFEPEFEFESRMAQSEGTVWRGFEGLRGWAADLDAVWEDFRVEVERVEMAAPDMAVVTLRISGRARGSGIPLDENTGHVWRARNGRLWQGRAYPTVAEARRAAGLEGD